MEAKKRTEKDMKTIAPEKAARRGAVAPVYGTKGAKTGADNEADQDQENHDQEETETEESDESESGKTSQKAKSKEKAKAKSKADGSEESEDESEQDDNELSAKELSKIVCKGLEKTLRKVLPQSQSKNITEEGLEDIIEKVHKRFTDDSVKVTRKNLDEVMEEIVAEQIKSIRKEKRHVNNAADANESANGKSLDIEIPVSWTKGNLPLHGKQLMNIMLGKQMNDGIDAAMIEKGKALGDRNLSYLNAQAKSLQMRGKAMTSTGAGTGDEFVPTDLSANLLSRFFIGSPLAAVFMADEIPMPTDPYVFPLSTTRPSFLWESTENTNFTPSDPGTANTTLQTVRMAGEVDYSDELDEDSIIAILPLVQQKLAEGAIDAWENALINGDTTGTHQDSDTAAGSAKLPAKSMKGFRKLALAISSLKSDMSSGGIGTNANFLALRKLMKKYGGNPKNLIWVCSPTAAITMQGIAETVSLEKFGSRATIITGEIAALQGIPIIQSEQVREDVNASGVYDGTTTTKSTVLCINKTRFLTGFRRQFRIEKDKLIQSGKTLVVASFRKAFTPIEVPSATVTSVSIGYNFAP